jgi:cytochrome b involved in lipid metabolism
MSFTLDQVKQHSERESLWLVIENKVYDVTKFIEDHPVIIMLIRVVKKCSWN